MIVDAQLHPYRRDASGRSLLGKMSQAGVGKAVLVSSFTHYRFDSTYAIQVANEFPDRFRVVVPVDLSRDDAVKNVARWAKDPMVVGVRLLPAVLPALTGDRRSARRFLSAVEAVGLPLCVFLPSRLDIVSCVARSFPELILILDHLGLPVPTSRRSARLLDGLPQVLALAEHPHVRVKVSGAPALAPGPYPFASMWPLLHRVLASFGVERCMWGTDWTRMPELRYGEVVSAFRDTTELPATDLDRLMGKSAAEAFGWPSSTD